MYQNINKMLNKVRGTVSYNGSPGSARTNDPLINSQMLLPAELQGNTKNSLVYITLDVNNLLAGVVSAALTLATFRTFRNSITTVARYL